MDDRKFGGVIIKADNGSEASLIIPVGSYRVMVLSDDGCGSGKGEICRSELYVYQKDNRKDCINEDIFGSEFVIADTDSLLKAIQYCQQLNA